MIILKSRSEVKVTVTQKWYMTSPSKDVFILQIKDSYPKEYRRYAQDLMLILETRSEVKVTVTGK